MNDRDSIIAAKDVVKTYTQGAIDVHALRGIDLQVRSGEFTVIAGSSGSGKTTLLNLVGGLDKPTSGTLLLDGDALSEMSIRRLADLRLRRIGFVFRAYDLLPVLSGDENAEYLLLLQGVSAAERKERAEAVLSAVGLEGMIHRRPAELSGG